MWQSSKLAPLVWWWWLWCVIAAAAAVRNTPFSSQQTLCTVATSRRRCNKLKRCTVRSLSANTIFLFDFHKIKLCPSTQRARQFTHSRTNHHTHTNAILNLQPFDYANTPLPQQRVGQHLWEYTSGTAHHYHYVTWDSNRSKKNSLKNRFCSFILTDIHQVSSKHFSQQRRFIFCSTRFIVESTLEAQSHLNSLRPPSVSTILRSRRSSPPTRHTFWLL